VQVDAGGRLLRQVGNTDPIPGCTLRLTLDSELQAVAFRELSKWAEKGNPGAAVALDPNTGAVLALCSAPSYDPGQFVSGISRPDWESLQSNPFKPQINRAISSSSAPGSTFKVISASAGLETAAITRNTTDYCTGMIRLGTWIKRCHKASGHGRVDLNEAIAQSCDVYFYHLGQKLGPDVMADYARKFGLGSPTGIDLSRPGDSRLESAGTVPDPAWKLSHKRGPWVGGDTVDYAIGQAMLRCTPLQMCNVAAAIANGGTLFKPQVVQSIAKYDTQNRGHVVQKLTPTALSKLPVSQATLALIVRGMRSVMEPGGTASHASIPGLAVGGKTGTAQIRRHSEVADNAWFIGFAPVAHPTIAVCVFVEGGGHGGDTAAPIARKMIAQFLKIKVDDIRPVHTTD
jgi:penicillin-binding protein 2